MRLGNSCHKIQRAAYIFHDLMVIRIGMETAVLVASALIKFEL